MNPEMEIIPDIELEVQNSIGKNLMAKELNEIALFIKKRRKANNLTQKELAELANVSRGAISLLENGSEKVRMHTVFNVLNVFGKSLELNFIEAKRDDIVLEKNVFSEHGKKMVIPME